MPTRAAAAAAKAKEESNIDKMIGKPSTEKTLDDLLEQYFNDSKYKGNNKQSTITEITKLLNNEESTKHSIIHRFSNISKDDKKKLRQLLTGTTSGQKASPQKHRPPSPKAKKTIPPKKKLPTPPSSSTSSQSKSSRTLSDIEMTIVEKIQPIVLKPAPLTAAIPIPPIRQSDIKHKMVKVVIEPEDKEISEHLLNYIINFCKIVKYISLELLYMKHPMKFDDKTDVDKIIETFKSRQQLKDQEMNLFTEIKNTVDNTLDNPVNTKKIDILDNISKKITEIHHTYEPKYYYDDELSTKYNISLSDITSTEIISLKSIDINLINKIIKLLQTIKQGRLFLLYQDSSNYSRWASSPVYKLTMNQYSTLKSLNIFEPNTKDAAFFKILFVDGTDKLETDIRIRTKKNKKTSGLLKLQPRGASARVAKKGDILLRGGEEELLDA